MENIFDKLLHLPLFQGVSQERLQETVEKVPFHFLKFRKGEKILSCGDECTHVRFVVSGRVKLEYESKVLKFKISHELEAPEVIAPDYLFGLDTCYPFSVNAIENCGILQLAKQDYVAMLRTDNVFLFNILNYLSRNSQVRKSQLLNLGNASVQERLVMLVSAFTSQRSQNITMTFRQRDLCRLLGARRPALVSAISFLNDNGLINMPDSSTINIANRHDFIQQLKNTQ
ncbi:MAG: Crp/Fnr family transcriptional regulator [Muribaculaceae bacterium]|nr:Crp/Fnr family transcriptional regulator [Muribaculaceae bacterium]MBR5118020.1 Crp/Fnr family transcriptional regulator [Muribaculaceae bacterium]